MAKINRRRTDVMRTDPELSKIIRGVMAKNLQKGKMVRAPRVTLAMARQYLKYPNLLKELEEAELK